jgi:hypothetical protein
MNEIHSWDEHGSSQRGDAEAQSSPSTSRFPRAASSTAPLIQEPYDQRVALEFTGPCCSWRGPRPRPSKSMGTTEASLRLVHEVPS